MNLKKKNKIYEKYLYKTIMKESLLSIIVVTYFMHWMGLESRSESEKIRKWEVRFCVWCFVHNEQKRLLFVFVLFVLKNNRMPISRLNFPSSINEQMIIIIMIHSLQFTKCEYLYLDEWRGDKRDHIWEYSRSLPLLFFVLYNIVVIFRNALCMQIH